MVEVKAKELAGGDTLPERAMRFAAVCHGQQRRKYTDEPYINHPKAVAAIVKAAGGSEAMIAAAYLHDVVEDTPVTIGEVRELFGGEVGSLVAWLTDVSKPEDGNRKLRKAMDRDHIASAPAAAKTIKLADLIDNTSSIRDRDPDFWKVYQVEKLALLEVLKDGDAGLWARANDQCQD